MPITLLVLFALGCGSSQPPVFTPDESAQRRVLVIAIDGLRPDALQAHAPTLREFGMRHQHTWNSTVAIPISAPSWCTIFSGLSNERTGVTNNAFTGTTLSPEDNRLASGDAQTVFNHLDERGMQSAVISTGTWNGIENIAAFNREDREHDQWVRAENNRPREELAAQTEGIDVTIQRLEDASIDLVVFYTHHVDNAGHIFGHDPSVLQYVTATEQTDENLQRLLEALERRERMANEDWLVLITTDHGGSSRWRLEQSEPGLGVLASMDADEQVNAGISQRHLEGVHGLRSDGVIDHEQTRTFILMKHGNRSAEISEGRSNRDITPTILHFLFPEEANLRNQLDGRSLLE